MAFGNMFGAMGQAAGNMARPMMGAGPMNKGPMKPPMGGGFLNKMKPQGRGIGPTQPVPMGPMRPQFPQLQPMAQAGTNMASMFGGGQQQPMPSYNGPAPQEGGNMADYNPGMSQFLGQPNPQDMMQPDVQPERFTGTPAPMPGRNRGPMKPRGRMGIGPRRPMPVPVPQEGGDMNYNG